MGSQDQPTEEAVSRVLIIDDHPIIQEGFSQLLNRQKDLKACGVAGDFNEALRQIEATHPDLLLVDIALKDGNGLDLIKTIKARHTNARILVVSTYDDNLYAERALNAGALGYVNKQEATENLLEGIRLALKGKIYLSERMKERMLQRARGANELSNHSAIESLANRELEVFELIGTGLTTAEIAERLCRSIHTINTHRQRIKAKLSLKNSAELTRAATQWVLEAGTESATSRS